MPRVAILFEYPTLYGGERSMLAALNAMDRSQIEIVAIAPAEGLLAEAIAEIDIEHVPFQVFDENRKRRPREQVLPALVEVVQQVAPDVLHANSLSMSVMTGQLKLPIPRIGHLRDIVRLSKNVINTLNKNDLLLAVSEATRNFHVGNGVDPLKTRVAYNGVDTNVFAPDLYPRKLRKELGVPDDTMLALTVGQIGLRKGLDVLVRAIKLVAPKLEHLHFLIVGERSSSKAETIEYERELHESLAEAELTNRVHWLGYRTDIPQLMNEADLLVHAAKQEPLGRVLLESAAAGLPMVATEVGGTSEIVQDKLSARLVPPNDENELAIGIWELASDPDLRSRFALAARETAVERFCVSEADQQLLRAWKLFLLS